MVVNFLIENCQKIVLSVLIMHSQNCSTNSSIALTFSKSNFFYRTSFCQFLCQLLQFEAVCWILFKIYLLVSRPYFGCLLANHCHPVEKFQKSDIFLSETCLQYDQFKMLLVKSWSRARALAVPGGLRQLTHFLGN